MSTVCPLTRKSPGISSRPRQVSSRWVLQLALMNQLAYSVSPWIWSFQEMEVTSVSASMHLRSLKWKTSLESPKDIQHLKSSKMKTRKPRLNRSAAYTWVRRQHSRGAGSLIKLDLGQSLSQVWWWESCSFHWLRELDSSQYLLRRVSLWLVCSTPCSSTLLLCHWQHCGIWESSQTPCISWPKFYSEMDCTRTSTQPGSKRWA